MVKAAGEEWRESLRKHIAAMAGAVEDEKKAFIQTSNDLIAALSKVSAAHNESMKKLLESYEKEALGVKDGGNLSKASLETLAVIAYNQPVTRAYIDQVRGVDSAYSLGVLADRELITEMGRMDVPGRPRLYGTTEVFLRVFGLSDISELPPLALAGGEGV
jgi:segregation and condensation protein B